MKISQKISMKQIPNIQAESFVDYIKQKLEEYNFYEIAHLIRGYSLALLKQICNLNDKLYKLVQLNIREQQQRSNKKTIGYNLFERVQNSKQKNMLLLSQNQNKIQRSIQRSQKENSIMNPNQEIPLDNQINPVDPFADQIFQPENSTSKMQEFYDNANQNSGQKNNILFDQDLEIFSKQFKFNQGQNFQDFQIDNEELKELEEKFSIQDTNLTQSEKQTKRNVTKGKLDKEISEDIENIQQLLENLGNFKKGYQDLMEEVFDQKIDEFQKNDGEDKELQELIDVVKGNQVNEEKRVQQLNNLYQEVQSKEKQRKLQTESKNSNGIGSSLLSQKSKNKIGQNSSDQKFADLQEPLNEQMDVIFEMNDDLFDKTSALNQFGMWNEIGESGKFDNVSFSENQNQQNKFLDKKLNKRKPLTFTEYIKLQTETNPAYLFSNLLDQQAKGIIKMKQKDLLKFNEIKIYKN